MKEHQVISRAEQKKEDTWRLEDIYETQEECRADLQRLPGEIASLQALQGRLQESLTVFQKALQQYGELCQAVERVQIYASQNYHQDTANAASQELFLAGQQLGMKFSQDTAWLEPELLSMPPALLEEYLSHPELALYRRQIEVITRRREHILEPQQEEMLARASELGQAPSNIFSMFHNADLRFPDVTDEAGAAHALTISSFGAFLQSTDRTLRRNAFQTLYRVYQEHENMLAALLYAHIKQANFFARERHYQNAMEESLAQFSIPTEVYTNLISAVQEHLPAMHRYVRLRRRLLHTEELHMYDVRVPIVEKPSRTYTFEQAKEIVRRGLQPLGEDYLAILQEGFDNRWIDVYENRGKRTGAYSWGTYDSHPYVLLNYYGQLDDVFTLAHEMGHSLHSYYSNHAQPYLYSGYSIFVAETASTVNEALLIRHLLKESKDEKEKKYLINYFLEQFKSTVYRQTMFAEFELEAHQAVQKGQALTAESLKKSYLALNAKYFGPDMVLDPEIAMEWARIPHFYFTFYVYQYATGFAAAIAISSKILNGEPQIVEKYKEFLSSGSTKDPLDLLRICGVDLSVPDPVHAALRVFEDYLGELEELTK